MSRHCSRLHELNLCDRDEVLFLEVLVILVDLKRRVLLGLPRSVLRQRLISLHCSQRPRAKPGGRLRSQHRK